MSYGKIIRNLEIEGKPAPYPVVNERGVRATAGIMFAIGISTFFTVMFTREYIFLNIVVITFWLDFFLKTVFQPHWSFFNIIGDFLVRKQKPEYVGAVQKRFAWGMGLGLATFMILGPVLFQIRGLMPLSICLACLFLIWMESALGVCVGCKIYKFLLDKKILKEPTHRPVCPGGVCSIKR
ncbi:DUF4395 domain-containing protein [Candidatus Peregrinibacteria bacterium]|jgi:hypothetical protein|nr:DUF4395 domain-containing protein [Candidatus Peregrinibacteria bacterium]